MLSATLTATDTISVLSLIKKKKFPKVHTIIFGEGILNDSVAIIFYHISSKMKSIKEEINLFNLNGFYGFLYEFVIVSCISVLVGIVICYFCFYVVNLKVTNILH